MQIPSLHPDPNAPYPCEFAGNSIGFLKNLVNNAMICIGDFTYYHGDAVDQFQEKNVLYHYPHCGDKLVIGRFCQIANGTQFIMNGAIHPLHGVSTFPFDLFGGEWTRLGMENFQVPNKGDTHVGNDVWFGKSALIMPGINIGNGAVIAAHSVVTKDVPAYAIVAGNPARIVRMRYSDEDIRRLQEIAWWHWPIEKITRYIPDIMQGNIDQLEQAKQQEYK
ncbi:CatB-related O-acetyltransferase [Cellvibrio mixtus]|uniref:CatB-related O-acetyltransferase n=1 Tax=Cellvibrio mixtus TaxID=39650 RepID=UPI0039953D3A